VFSVSHKLRAAGPPRGALNTYGCKAPTLKLNRRRKPVTAMDVFRDDSGAMAARSVVWLAALALAMAQAWASASPPPAPTAPGAAEPKEKAEIVEPIPDDVQLIAALDPQLKETFARRELAVWPSADEIRRKKALEDRSGKFPAKFPPGKDYSNAKPLRVGAIPPEAALKGAEHWIRTVLKAEWVPSDLAARLHALAEEDPANSAVWCRYKIKGHAIQIGQTRGVMCVVIRPSEPKGEGETALDFGRRCLKQFPTKDEKLAQMPMEAVSLKEPELSMFKGHGRTPDELAEWWGHVVWYTDGKAVALFLGKRSVDSSLGIGPDTPWF